jgi:antitoxin (DNA-binding transcriptional repressor) of toxin-antitoxin stability system
LFTSVICCANGVHVQMIASRELSSKPGAVLSRVASEGTMVVTRDGRPMAILTPTSPESLVEDLQEIAFSKARRAVRNLRSRAGEAGIDSLSAEEIEKEIQAVRKSAK